MRAGILLVGMAVCLSCEPPRRDARVFTHEITIDRRFSDEQQAAIVEAVEFWTEATDGRFDPGLVIGEVDCYDRFSVVSVRAEESCMRIGEQRQGGVMLGNTDDILHSVAVASWRYGSGFLLTVAHEIGHYLYLDHAEFGLMRADAPELKLSKRTKRDYCEIWGC